ncbi:P27 family phage terminase small subunit [Acetobacter oeni]|uniref:Terminase n=1 Tax=Acetobacter oeni TaxID=304077 RepID=A0A511XP28_9PROT|nr:P27 family phage terminase small subunit [Acetobacter oeni]MBB3884478.1 P27 family predicted phage terminase small subunit [Acetobacter oeni]NHO20410.1 phage terminase small subunit P27 family [Acetobacter oeni]GEN64711.1 hypothetical protein AOE01nite_29350 [Acetobacter oeni]
MARPRKPTHLKVVSGTAQKCRVNAQEPKPDGGVPEMPAQLSGRARSVWGKACVVLADMGVLTMADGMALEALCLAIADEQEARASLMSAVSIGEGDEKTVVAEAGAQTYVTVGKSGPMLRMRPEVAAIADANRRVAMWLAKFGLTPADRSRVGAEDRKADNPFERLG